jgi:putative endonuclease
MQIPRGLTSARDDNKKIDVTAFFEVFALGCGVPKHVSAFEAPQNCACHHERAQRARDLHLLCQHNASSGGICIEKRTQVLGLHHGHRSKTLYAGITDDMFRRALEHKNGTIEGFTKRYHINRLVYFEVFKYVTNAIRREKQIKGWDRAKRLALIESMNPTWVDLAEGWGEAIEPLNADPSLRS